MLAGMPLLLAFSHRTGNSLMRLRNRKPIFLIFVRVLIHGTQFASQVDLVYQDIGICTRALMPTGFPITFAGLDVIVDRAMRGNTTSHATHATKLIVTPKSPLLRARPPR